MTPRGIVESSLHAGDVVLLATQPDQRLIDLVRSGNERAFEVIVRRYRRPLLAYCRRLLPSDSAEDAVQQAFLNAYVAMKRGQSELRLRPWLQQIAHNASLDVLRRKALPREEHAADLAGGNGSDEMSERREELGALLAAVDSLPDRQRAAILLRELNGLSYAEIAEDLGVGVGAVRQLLSRARHGVRDGVGAMVPPVLLLRLPAGSSGPDLGARVAEMCGGAAGAGALVKTVATVAAVGAIAGGLGQPSQDVESARVEREASSSWESSSTGARAGEAPSSVGSGAAVADLRPTFREAGGEGSADTDQPRGDARRNPGGGAGVVAPTGYAPDSPADGGGGHDFADETDPGAGSPAADEGSFDGDDDGGLGAGSPVDYDAHEAGAASGLDGDDDPEPDAATPGGDDADDADADEGDEGVGLVGNDRDRDAEAD